MYWHACRFCSISKLPHDVLARLADGSPFQLPGLGNGLQDCGEAGPALDILWREVCAACEGLKLRGQEYAHGPAASPLRRLNEGHLQNSKVFIMTAQAWFQTFPNMQSHGNVKVRLFPQTC